MEDESRILGMALSFVPGMDAQTVRYIREQGLTPADFFSMPQGELSATLSLKGAPFADRMVRDEALFRARKEAEFMRKHGIISISITDDD